MQVIETLKHYLLNNFEGFVDNESFIEYLTFIAERQSSEVFTLEYYEKHHVIPVSCYKLKYGCKNRQEALKYANADLNNFIVALSYKDHCKAHYLLYFSTEGSLQQLMATPLDKLLKVLKPSDSGYLRCLRNKQVLLKLTDEDFEQLQNYKNQMYNNKESIYWTKAEEDIIRQNYGKVSLACLQKLLPNRSIDAIRDHATKRLQLRVSKEWTEEELEILYTYYASEGSKITNRLPNRKWRAITTQACLLGIHTKNYWTEEEIQILIEYYPKEAGKVQSKLTTHSITNIYSKVKELKQKGLL